MRKRIIAGVLAAAMSFGSMAVLPQGFSFFNSTVANADDVSGDYWYVVGSNGAIITKYIGSAKTISFPPTIGGAKVVTIGNGDRGVVMSNVGNITSVVIPSGVTKINEGAFDSLYALTSITIPSTVTYIGESAFSSCSALKSITIPNGVTTIGREAFQNCTGLTSVTIPDSVTTIGEDAFNYCTNLKTVTVPKTVTSIGAHAFGFKEDKVMSDFKLQCYANTAASDYAEKYLPDNYVLLDSSHTHKYDYNNGKVTKQATCEEKGETTYYCSCGASKTEKNIAALGHSFTVFVKTVPPTETEQGYDVYKCSRCSKTHNTNYTNVVQKGDLSKATITLPKTSYEYTGSKICPVPTVTYNGTKLTQGTDYKVEYTDNLNVGTATVIIRSAGGNYSGQNSTTFRITVGTASNLSNASILGVESSYTYTGGEIKPEPTVMFSGKLLTKGTDYSVSYKNNTNVGTATLTVTGKGNYGGSKSVSFTITSPSASLINLSGATISGLTNKTYTGSAQTQNITVTCGGKTLTANTDYTVSYNNNTNVGTATVTVTGKGNYTGSKSATFKITALGIGSATISGVSGKTYTGSAITQTPVVKYGTKTLTANTDYTVSYKNNVNVGTATLTVTGKGNYTGSKSASFTISAANMSSTSISGISISYTYTGKAITPAPTVKLGSRTLTANTDYTVSYKNNTNAGTATVTVTGKGNFTGTKSTTFTIVKSSGKKNSGDVNDDGKIDIKDVTLLKQYVANWKVTVNATNADTNGNGQITIADVTLLKQYVANWKVTLK